MTGPRTPMEERFWAKVEKTDTCWNWTASTVAGYGQLKIDGRPIRAHRISYELMVGPIPAGMFVDHRCHQRACVNPEHLRLATPKQNVENQRGAMSNSTTGLRGVYWIKDHQSWRAQVMHNGELIYLGYYSNKEDANAAVVAKRNELFTHNDADRRAA